MHSPLTRIFLTGPTGYIGGSVLSRLLSHSLSDTFQTTVLVRSETKAKQFRTLGVRAIVGSNQDLPLLRQLAREADIVFACSDADDLDAAKAILDGLRLRHEKTGKISSLIHTSGTGVLVDDAKGMYSTENIYSDLDIEKLETLAPEQPHRIVDLTLVDVDNQGCVNTYIVLPSTIYGIAQGPLVDLGLQNAHSQQIPALIRTSIDRGQGGMVGQGKNMWPNVHIDDIANLYILLFDEILSSEPSPYLTHGRTGFYFGENGEHVLYDVSATIARILYDRKKGRSPEPTPFTDSEMAEYFPRGTSLGSNSRCRAERARKIGWKPKYTTQDMLASIRHEIKS